MQAAPAEGRPSFIDLATGSVSIVAHLDDLPDAPAGSSAAAGLDGMVALAGGTFIMGSDRHYPEEAPAHHVAVDAFAIDRAPVTNRSFRSFVDATGHATVAEIAPDPALYPGADPAVLVPGSLVFRPPASPAAMRFFGDWWDYRRGACWHRPDGRTGLTPDLDDHPVLHIAFADAHAFALWAGKELPTEAEWEFAARGGLPGRAYAWGDELMPDGVPMANTWQGRFPFENQSAGGHDGTSPVGGYPANGYGLVDMIGNVWEWTADWYRERHPRDADKPCCVPRNPRGGDQAGSADPRDPSPIPRKVIKGGSHLCAPNYCQRYRPAARHPQAVDSGTSHIGFRCVRRLTG